jgi:hypothetical protein
MTYMDEKKIGNSPKPGAAPSKQALTELRRLDEMEAREQKRLADQELKNISRGMRGRSGRKPAWVLALGSGAALVLLIGLWMLFGVSQMRQARTSYNSARDLLNLVQLARYAPKEIAEVEKLAAQAEDGNALFSGSRMRRQYRQASELLLATDSKVGSFLRDYQQLSTEYDGLAEEARSYLIPQYAPDFWAKVLALRAKGETGGNGVVNFQKVMENLRQATQELASMRPSLPDLKEFHTVYTRFVKSHSQLNQSEWQKNLPDKLSQYNELAKQADQTRQELKWAQTTDRYLQAEKIVEAGLAVLSERRQKASADLEAFQQQLSAANSVEIQQFASSAWSQIQALAQKAQTAMTQFDYAAVSEATSAGGNMLTTTQSQVASRRQTQGTLLENAQKAYARISVEQKFFRRNWPAAWEKIQDGYQTMTAALKAGRQDTVLREAQHLEDRIEALEKLGVDLRKTAGKSQDQFQAALKAVDTKLFELNVPEIWVKIQQLQSDALREWALLNLVPASESFDAAVKLLGEGSEQLQRLRSQVSSLEAQVDALQRRFQLGIDAFRPEATSQTKSLSATAKNLIALRNWRSAQPILQQWRDLLPTQRFLADSDGTVRDFESGLTWVANVASAGCNNGQPLTWYDALVWVKDLSFAGHRDWQLPDNDELGTLLRADPAELDRFFPNSRQRSFWSRTPDPAQVDQAIFANQATGTLDVDPKRKSHLVRPVRKN